ncbi:MAG TPA: LLM class flavin-dependent oxidoreductase [Candidatus Binataceae bacterium]|nr:LLM class flavin-dependent oxidoreductase [Candidatus Binataceae bacterium]
MAVQQRPIEFGLFLHQIGYSVDQALAKVQAAERLGYHSVWFADHFWGSADPKADHLECLTLMTAAAVHSQRLRIGSLVICNGFRNPALLAKTLTSMDHISGGRIEIGLGIGWKKEEFLAYGYEYPDNPVRLRQLEDSLRIMQALFHQPKATVEGRYFRIDEALNFPKPLQQPHPPITLGGAGKQVMLKLVAKYADNWNIPGGHGDLDDLIATLRGHCQAVGRDFASLGIAETVLVALGESERQARDKWLAVQKDPFAPNAIKGTAEQVIAAFKARIAKGINRFVIKFADGMTPPVFEDFARAVMPALR